MSEAKFQPELMETPSWIVIRLGDDHNWWLEQTSEQVGPTAETRGILDPRQVQWLLEMLDQHREFGLRDVDVQGAFAAFVLESEIGEDQLRLIATDESRHIQP